MNNAAGALVIASGANLAMPNVAVGTGFDLEVEGTAVFAGLNVNGSSQVTVAAGGSLTISSSFSPGTGNFTNAGTLHIASSMNLNTSVVLTNSGTMTVDQSSSINGPVTNSGTLQIAGSLTVNGSGQIRNGCAMSVAGDLSNNGAGSSNSGLLLVSGGFSNNGSWSQSPAGTLASSTLTDDGSVSGFGQYHFGGQTSVQGSFVGDSSSAPITVDTTAPAGQSFNVQNGTVANVVRGSVGLSSLAAYPAPDCGTPRPSADLIVAKSGPASVTQGSSVTYAVTVSNAGPGSANAVAATDALPAGLTGVTASNGGVVNGASVTWNLGTIAAAGTTTVTITGTATGAAGTTLLDVASATSSTPDPNPENNDGSSESSRAETDIVALVPPNTAPVADDQTFTTTTGIIVLGRATASDAQPDQALRYSIVGEPSHGVIGLLPGGGFAYRSAADFTGVDSATFQVCDNGTPVLCDQGVLTFDVYPIATDDADETYEGEPVDIPILLNSVSPGAVLVTPLVAPPANGTVTLDTATGIATYTPNAGFIGTDSFTFQICSPTAPTLCDTGTVAITVVKLNRPPIIADILIQTTTDTPVEEHLPTSDPDGNPLVITRGAPARSGAVRVAGDGTVVYTPRPGFAGRDQFSAIVCDDGEPMLCATGNATVEVTPIANADTATTPTGVPVSVDVAANDLGTVDPPSIVTPPSHGTVVADGTGFTYTPAADFDGTDTFEYQICAINADDLCATATATITVEASIPPTPPVPPEPPLPPNPLDPTGGLAFTGADVIGPLTAGLGAVAGGGVLLLAVGYFRRRRRA
jgi:uncharacterized repeat protein (TIGR01451 family)